MIFYKANFVVQKGEITIYSIWLSEVRIWVENRV